MDPTRLAIYYVPEYQFKIGSKLKIKPCSRLSASGLRSDDPERRELHLHREPVLPRLCLRLAQRLRDERRSPDSGRNRPEGEIRA